MLPNEHRPNVTEIERHAASGLASLLFLIVGLLASSGLFIAGAATKTPALAVVAVLAWTALFIALFGLFVVNPNEGKVLQLFGSYVGTVKQPGLWWANPFYTKRSVSQRVRNFETSHLKVNDFDGNPIEIAAVVVWKVTDTAQACFHVDAYE